MDNIKKYIKDYVYRYKRKRLAKRIFRVLKMKPYDWQIKYCISDNPSFTERQVNSRGVGKTTAVIVRALMCDSQDKFLSETTQILMSDPDLTSDKLRINYLVNEYYYKSLAVKKSGKLKEIDVISPEKIGDSIRSHFSLARLRGML